MTTPDAPDWEHIVQTVEATGDVPDAPDWERIVVGPGGTPVGPSPGGGVISLYYQAGFIGLTVDPAAVQSNSGHTEGVVGLITFTALATAEANYVYAIMAGGASCTADENFVGIYDQGNITADTFTLLAATATGVCDTPFADGGIQKLALSSSASLTEGLNYAVGFLNNGGAPTFCSASVTIEQACNPLGTTYPFRVFLAAPNTSLPHTIAYSATSLTNNVWLWYVSTS
jgi:hypothetical protein